MNRPEFLNRESAYPYLSIALLIGASLLLAWLFSSFLWPIFLALVLYTGFLRTHRRMEERLGGRKNLSAALSMFVVLLLIIGPLALLVRQLVLESIDLVIRFKDILSSDDILRMLPHIPSVLDPLTGDPFFWVELQDTVLVLVDRYTSFLDPDKLGSLLGNASSLVFGSMAFTLALFLNLLLALVILYFLFRDGDQLYRFIEAIIPIPQDRLDIFTNRLRDSLRAVIRGNLFVSLLQGAAIGLGLTICGMSRGLLFGAVAAVFSLIPIVGTAVVWLPAAAYLALFEGSYGYALFLVVYGPAMYLILENIVKPKVLDHQLGIHPVFLFFAILGGLAEFGITGVIIGPLLVTIFVTIWSIVPKREAPREPVK